MHTVYPYICLLKKIEHGTKNFRIPFSRIPNIIHLIFTLILTRYERIIQKIKIPRLKMSNF